MLRAAGKLLDAGRARAVRGAGRSAKAFLNRAAEGAGVRPGRRLRRRMAVRDAEVSALRRELARVRGDVPSAGAGRAAAPVFFVVGQKKSGTTWLMRMLDSHPEILCKGEGRFFGGGWRREALKGASCRARSTRRCWTRSTSGSG